MEITGSARKKFYFPASQETAFHYLGDVSQMMSLFPTVTIETQSTLPSGEPAYRLRYESQEMGVYLVTVFCDAFLSLAPDQTRLSLLPIQDADNPFAPVKPKVGSNGAVAIGKFNLNVGFEPESEAKTIVDYQLSIKTFLELGGFFNFMPKSLIEGMVAPLASDRLKDVVDRFIIDAVTTYRKNAK
ncbi:MAG: hypothetical protein AAF633_25410 [Chloroflexota bacterium]